MRWPGVMASRSGLRKLLHVPTRGIPAYPLIPKKVEKKALDVHFQHKGHLICCHFVASKGGLACGAGDWFKIIRMACTWSFARYGPGCRGCGRDCERHHEATRSLTSAQLLGTCFGAKIEHSPSKTSVEGAFQRLKSIEKPSKKKQKAL